MTNETKVDYRKKICVIISKMLDNPDEYEIYPTAKCYDELEAFIKREVSKAYTAGCEQGAGCGHGGE